jgi:hypothetical protein
MHSDPDKRPSKIWTQMQPFVSSPLFDVQPLASKEYRPHLEMMTCRNMNLLVF